ncbi:MAG: transcriptional regulator, MerR family [Dehalococcoidia bacterium]|nr:transcriptional regulator, MerR family [Dehalococcoidia bacterium]
MTEHRDQPWGDEEPCYVISVAARMIRVHSQTLRYYEREGLLEPARSKGNIRLYSQRDIERLRHIKTLMDDLGLNLAGVQVVLQMMNRMAQMEHEIEQLAQQLEQLQSQGKEGASADPH